MVYVCMCVEATGLDCALTLDGILMRKGNLSMLSLDKKRLMILY